MLNPKRVFVLADAINEGRFETIDSFLVCLRARMAEISAYSDAQVDSIIKKWPPRFAAYEEARWEFKQLDLNKCFVWTGMGGLAWAKGCVFDVATLFQQYKPSDNKVWEMMRFVDIFSSQLPIIVLKNQSGLWIDDGSHRAVAMALSGIRKVSAWVGTQVY